MSIPFWGSEVRSLEPPCVCALLKNRVYGSTLDRFQDLEQNAAIQQQWQGKEYWIMAVHCLLFFFVPCDCYRRNHCFSWPLSHSRKTRSVQVLLSALLMLQGYRHPLLTQAITIMPQVKTTHPLPEFHMQCQCQTSHTSPRSHQQESYSVFQGLKAHAAFHPSTAL